MIKKNIIPLNVPNLGYNPQQQFDINEGIDQICNCGNKTFEKFVYIKRIPKISKNNKTGKDINLEIISYFCTACGNELKVEG